MMQFKYLPQSYKKYSLVKANIRNQNYQLADIFNRFMWRYRLAKSFKGIQADENVGQRTLQGYAEGMRLFLAYAAYDEIRNAEQIIYEKNKKIIHQINEDIDLANKIRTITALKKILCDSENIKEDKLIRKLNGFYELESNDVMLVASAFRHTFVHGDLTSAGAGLTHSKKNRLIINDLSNVVLDKADEICINLLSIY